MTTENKITATPTPWSRDKYGYMTADGENLYVAHGVTVPNGEHHPRYAEAFANEELILKAVNNHDALVAALKETNEALMFSAVVKTPQGKDDLQKKMWELRKDIVRILEQINK
jgi:hypothetical protein